jgi:hypothetical protein
MKSVFQLILVLLFTAAAQAQFAFITNNGSITVTGYTGAGGNIVIPDSINGMPVTSVGDGTFGHFDGVTGVTIPDSVINIVADAFALCSSLTNAIIGTNVASIEGDAFYFSGLESIIIPGSVTNIGPFAFDLCTNLSNLTIANGVTSIGYSAFDRCSKLTSLTIPGSVNFLGNYAFVNCTGLTNITMENGASSIGSESFAFCYSLISVTIPGSVTSIGGIAFAGCYKLSNVAIANGVTTIGGSAFSGCSNLVNISIPASVTNIGNNAYSGCTSMKTITVDAQNLFYTSANGVLFDRNQKTLIQYPCGKVGNYTVPASVTNIATEAFGFCSGLFTVMIPASVASIGGNAFVNCNSLTNVFFKGNAPAIGGRSGLFSGVNGTVYYLPGAFGWGSTYGGLPTVLWNPQAQTGGTTFGVRTNKFGFTITGSSNLVIVVEACTNLANSSWTPVSTNTLNSFIGTNGTSYFSDPRWTNYPARFYRFRSP